MTRRAGALFDVTGTRFAIYPQRRGTPGFHEPEIINVASQPGEIESGPEDARLRVIDAPDKPPYFDDDDESVRWTPPYRNGNGHRRRPPVKPRNGHFDHLEPGDPDFSAAMPFAIVRCVLRVWESYLGSPVRWHFRDKFPVAELIPRVESRNAWSGDGFLEFGYPKLGTTVLGDRSDPFCENFDAIAHETGHLILKSVIGQMPAYQKSMEYRAHEEAAADMVAMVAALHFDSVVDRLLQDTSGMLLCVNLISRITEWGRNRGEEVRELFNDATIASVDQDPEVNKHKLSLPFSGAAYEIFVALYHRHLLERGAITRRLAERAVHRPDERRSGLTALKGQFAAALRKDPEGFKEALLDARDDFGGLLARTWQSVDMHGLTYTTAAAGMIAAGRPVANERMAQQVAEVFEAHGITPDPAG
jgi:hypothetical protein